MEAAVSSILRPAARSCVSRTRHTLRPQIRTKATAARSRRGLNIPPHPAFLASDSRLEQDHIIFNPPSSAPSVYHTPFKFLPKTDPRRRANLASLFESHLSTSPATDTAQGFSVDDLPLASPPKVIPSAAPITKEQVDEMRRLRAEDPDKWGVTALAQKYDIPRGFVMACCQAPKEKVEFERKKLELVQQRWGPIRRKAREDRKRRSEMLYRGEI